MNFGVLKIGSVDIITFFRFFNSDFIYYCRTRGTADKINLLLTAVTAKCVFCVTRAAGRASINAAADCADEDCPLNPYGPAAFKMVLAKLEFQGWAGGAVQ